MVPTTPYKGLVPYAEEDAAFFFGREPEREIITANLLAARLTLLYGLSGVGKSSVLQAGVAHHLRQLARANLAERGAPKMAVVVFSSWRDDPIAGLASCIRDAVAQAWDGRLNQPAPRDSSLTQALQVWAEQVDGPVLLILDQFEEYFLYHAEEDGEGTLAVELPRAVNRAGLRVNVLISLREDALAKLDRFKGRIPNLFDNYLRIEHLDREAARAAIEQPLVYFNQLHAADGRRFSIEPALVDAVLAQVKTGQVVLGEAGRGAVGSENGARQPGGQIETPYLQLVMTRLWDEEVKAGSHTLTLGMLEDLGGAENIVHTHLDAAMSRLAEREQDVAARIFHHLVTPSGTKIAYSVGDLAAYADVPQTDLIAVLERLSSAASRIVRPVAPPPDQPSVPRYEIFHDVLAPAVLDWRARYVQALKVRAAAQEQERQQREREAVRQRELEQLQALAAEQQRVAEVEHRRADEQARAVRRLRGGAIVLALLALLAIGSTAVAVRNVATAQQAQTFQALALSRQLAAQALNQLNGQNNTPGPALLLSLEAIRAANTVEARSSLLEGLEHNERPRSIGTLAGEGNGLYSSMALSPDGKTIAVGGHDGTVRFWDVAHRPALALGPPLMGHTSWVMSVAFSPDGRILASGGRDGTIRLWDVARRQLMGPPLMGHTSWVMSVAFSPDGRILASGGRDGTIRLWNVAERRPLAPPLRGRSRRVASVAFSPDGNILAAGDCGKLIVTTCRQGDIWLWDVARRKPLGAPLTGFSDVVSSLAFSPDGKTLASGSYDGTIRLWDVASRQPLGPALTAFSDWVMSVTFSPDGRTLAAEGRDGTVRLWDVTSRPPLSVPLGGSGGQVASVAFSPSGRTLASAGCGALIGGACRGGQVRLWDVASRRPLGPPLAHPAGWMLSVAFSPDGRILASGGCGTPPHGQLCGRGEIRLWDVASRRPLGAPLTVPGWVDSVAFSPDGKTLATGGCAEPIGGTCRQGQIRLWDVARRHELGTLNGQRDYVLSVAFSPDGKTLAAGSKDGTIRLWDVAHRQLLDPPLANHSGWVRSVAFSPDGKTLASAGADQTVRLWDVASKQEVGAALIEQEGQVLSVAFSPDGRTLASGSYDHSVQLWDVASRQPLGPPLVGHSNWVTSVAFSPDGRTLASGSADRTIRLWDVSLASWEQRACRIAGGNLTQQEWRQYLGDQPYHKTCPAVPA